MLNTNIPNHQNKGGLNRRSFLGLMFATGLNTQNVLAQVPGKLNGKKTPELVTLLDSIEEKIRASIPDGTRNPNERYFAIVPDKQNIILSDVKIYKGFSEKKVVKIYEGTKNIFPKAESIAGSGAGERIFLNDDGYILVAIGTPIPSESLIESERSHFPNTYTVSTPPNKAFRTPEIQKTGLQYLKARIKEVFEKDIRGEDITSDFSDIELENELDQRLPLLFAIVEHMDIATIVLLQNQVYILNS